MDNKLTKEEIETDLQISLNDQEYLNAIIRGIRAFISSDFRENRSSFIVDLLKYEILLSECIRIHLKIEEALENYNETPK